MENKINIRSGSQVIIHIGMHKTASTFLQRQYFRQLQGVDIYTEPKFYDRLGTYNIEDKFLISSEGLSGIPWDEAGIIGINNRNYWMNSFKMAVKNLKLIYPGAVIIIVFRKHGDLLISLYKQYIQEGGILPFEAFYGDERILREEDFSYEARWRFLEANFDHLYALSFEQFKQEGVTYFDRFFESIGLSRSSGDSKFHKQNQSISGSKIEILRAVNRYYRYVPRIIKKIIQVLRLSPRQVFQSKLASWQPKDPEILLKAKEQINDKMAEDWNFISKYFF